jgi:ATP-dependent exoDNAse (exonuclease V) alpha subunit
VFDRYDIVRALHRAIDDPEAFQSALVRVMASDALVELQAEGRDADGVIEPARYSTWEMVDIERKMAVATDKLLGRRDGQVAERHVRAAVAARSFLSTEQREAVGHVTGGSGVAMVVGLAGAGKSTVLAAAREAWEAGGYRVHGAALAGKAAEGLEESSGIVSRTLASWQRSWERGFDPIRAKDVFVIDEAGMVGSRRLAAARAVRRGGGTRRGQGRADRGVGAAAADRGGGSVPGDCGAHGVC